MRVFVTGATGFIGRALIPRLQRDGHAVVNLAGEPLMGGRWTAGRRAVLERSRIAVTEQLVQAMAEAKTRPRVFISGSAVGYYCDRGDAPLTEASGGGDDFLARLCRQWESAAQEDLSVSRRRDPPQIRSVVA